MTMKVKPLLLVFLLLASSFSYAQMVNTSRKEALEIQKRILLVALPNGGNKKAKDMFKSLVGKYWTFNKKIEYVAASKVKGLMKKHKNKYAVLKYSSFSQTAINKTRNPAYDSRNPVLHSQYKKSRYIANTIRIIMISLNGRKAHVKANLSSNYSLERNTIYGLMQMQYTLEYLVADPKNKSINTFYRKQIKKNAPELKNKTLLIDRELLAKKMTESKIKKYYPYPYKVVDAPTIDKALKTRSDAYAFIHIANLDVGKGATNIHFISSAKDGKIYLYVAPKVGFSGLNGIKFRQYHAIGKKQLKKYTKRLR